MDLARPDSAWWFSFATAVADLVATPLEHPGAYRVPALERALLRWIGGRASC